MYEEVEKVLLECEDRGKDQVPEDLKSYIRHGIRQGVKRKNRNRIKRFANLAALLFFVVFITALHTSSAFAAYAARIPGLDYLVKLINYDRGLKDAVDNGFIYNVDSSSEKEGIKLTIKDIIVDNSKAVIFYAIENRGDYSYIEIAEAEFTDEGDKELKAVSSWGDGAQDMRENKLKEGKLEIDFVKGETVIPNNLHMRIKLRASENPGFSPADQEQRAKEDLKSVWEFDIPIDKEKIKTMEEHYTMDKTLEIEGQKITFKDITINPTRISAEVQYDENNSKKILNFEDLEIVDEKGQSRGRIANGVTGSILGENSSMLYFQSNYFKDSQELYIKGSSLRALDKDKVNVEFDLKEGKILKAPDDKLTLESVTREGSQISLQFKLKVDAGVEKGYTYGVFYSIFKDSEGMEYNIKRAGSASADQQGFQHISIAIDDYEAAVNPISLQIYDYPCRIKGDFKVRIK